LSNEIALLLLRILSGLSLMALLAVIFVLLWRSTRPSGTAYSNAEQDRRLGALIVMEVIDGHLMVTGESYPLLPTTTLGRAPSNTVRIADTFASSEHAVVTLRDHQWWLEDRQSRNGTTLNDIPVTQPIVITQGDMIGIGSIKLRVDLRP
jgi:hypothetical protein